jgi:hypothetical protein
MEPHKNDEEMQQVKTNEIISFLKATTIINVVVTEYNILIDPTCKTLQSPHLRTPNPGLNPRFTPFLYNKCGG